MKNRKNNKGFSLVELIVVVAIMAVLVGVLAPAYLKYVENSREKKDLNNLEELRHAVEIAIAEEDIYAAIKDGSTVTVAVTTGAIATTDDTDSKLLNELKATIGTNVEMVSKKYDKAQTITIKIDSTTGQISVVAGTVNASGVASGWNS